MKHTFRTQGGFTLVEMAIVLVIIGLLLGGVMKGQAMIENARVKALAAEMLAITPMINGYRDLYKAFPGDDPQAIAHQPGASQATPNAGTGALDNGTWVGTAGITLANKTSVFWEHVRRAGFASGSLTSGTATNALGGTLGITAGLLRPTTPPNVQADYVICSSAIPGKVARALDFLLDDGVGTTGKMFGAVEAAGTPIVLATGAAAYVDASRFTVCLAQ